MDEGFERETVVEKHLKRFCDFKLPGVGLGGFDFRDLGLGDKVYSFDLFLNDFVLFVAANIKDIFENPILMFINLTGNCLTKLHLKRLFSQPILKFLAFYKLSNNLFTLEEVCEICNDECDRRFINVELCQQQIKFTLNLNLLSGDTIAIQPYNARVLKSAMSEVSKTIMNLRRLRNFKEYVTQFVQGLEATDKFVQGYASYSFEKIIFEACEITKMWSKQHVISKLISVYDFRNNRHLRSLSFYLCHFGDQGHFDILGEFLKEKPELTRIRFTRCAVSFLYQRERNSIWAFINVLLQNTSLLDIELDIDCRCCIEDEVFIEDEKLALIHERTERNKKLRQTLVTSCCLLIFHHRRIMPLHGDSTLRCCLPKDVMKIVAKMIFEDRFNMYPILDLKLKK
jgi:hypothetical protein